MIFRKEKKFIVPATEAYRQKELLFSLDEPIYSPYPARWINSIYLDYPDYQTMRESTEGDESRLKFRLRWYGENFKQLKHPQFEKKGKKDDLVFKRTEPCDLVLRDINTAGDIIQSLKKKFQLMPLIPTLFNRYYRHYFELKEYPIRVTFDSMLQQDALMGDRHRILSPFSTPHSPTIIELKYPPELEEKAAQLAQKIPFLLSNHSKYVNQSLNRYLNNFL
jgi:hypothetical protein